MSDTRRRFLTSTTAALLGSAAIPSLASADAAQKLTPTPLPRIHVHSDGHSLQTEDGRPFFWLGDTAWQLIHATSREECSYYLHARASQRFTVIQTVVLSEFDGIRKPSALGLLPFADADPSRPNDAYFDRVVEIVDEAASLGLYVALVATWGDKLTAPWGAGPALFRNDNLSVAHRYAAYLAGKVKNRTNVIWILGGDRPPRLTGLSNDYLNDLVKKTGFAPDQDWTPVWRAFAQGISDASPAAPLIVYHPQGGVSSSQYLHSEPWLSVNGMQSGHGGGHDVPVWSWVERDYALSPTKPTLDLEPNYEDHPYNPWPRWDASTGFFRDHDVRKQVYRSVFAGACGVTYGHNSVWGFVGTRNDPLNVVDRDWIDALYRPGGRHVGFLRQLMESRPFFRRIPDQSVIIGDSGTGGAHMQAMRDRDGTFAFVYVPLNDSDFTVNLSAIRSSHARAWWYDPRTGVGKLIGEMPTQSRKQFRTPPYGPDWVMVLDSVDANYSPPGLIPRNE